MQLTMNDGYITSAATGKPLERIDVAAAADVLAALHAITPALALAISTGAFLRRRSVIRLAQQHGLIAYDPVSSAKAMGLIA